MSADEGGGEGSNGDGAAGTGLYAAFQTVQYEAPPIINGRVPKNAYGNLDIYVPSMVPRGGVHLPYPEAARAAKTIGVDYADAVTGFEFRGRHGTAVIKGIVAAEEYREALKEVIGGFQDERAEAEEARRTAEALRMWRRFMAALRVMERIDGYDIEGERDAVHEEMDKADEVMVEGEGGGFLPDRDQEEVVEPTVRRFNFHQGHDQEVEDGGFMSESEGVDADAEEAFKTMQAPSEPHPTSGNIIVSRGKSQGGRFMLDEGTLDGGGFTPETYDESRQINPPRNLSTYDPGVRETLKDSELAEAITLQRLHDEGNFMSCNDSEKGGYTNEEDHVQIISNPPGPPDDGTRLPAEDHDRQTEVEADRNITAPQQLDRHHSKKKEEPQEGEEHEGEQENEEDRGSLLSHDPEDEDADPDWLASD